MTNNKKRISDDVSKDYISLNRIKELSNKDLLKDMILYSNLYISKYKHYLCFNKPYLVFELNPTILIGVRDIWLAKQKPEWCYVNNRKILLKHNKNWLLENKIDYMFKNYPDIVYEFNKDWIIENELDWVKNNYEFNE
jgi:hypothetical protein